MSTILIPTIALLGCVLFVLYLEQSKSLEQITRWVPAILFAYLVPAVLNNYWLHLDNNHPIYSWSSDLALPLTVLCAMASVSLEEIKIVGIKPLVYFLSSSAIIALLPLLLVVIFSVLSPVFHEFLIIENGYTSVFPVIGSWIGGSSSMLVMKELAQTPEDLFLSVLILDNVLVNIWTLFLFQWIKKTPKINNYFNRKPIEHVRPPSNTEEHKNPFYTLFTLAICFGLILIVQLNFLNTIIALSLIGIALGQWISFWDHKLLQKISKVLIVSVMSLLGLKLNFENLSWDPVLLSFLILWLLLQFSLSFWLAYRMKISLVWVPLASMANLGGVSTAPAVAAAYDKRLMPHAIVLAIVSMLTGTFWGLLALQLFKGLIPHL